ncbi:MAG: SPOR domain-containing protein [Bacteroidales bacterium]
MFSDNLYGVDVTIFIRELLFSHDCVILPGFGGFIGNYSPARIDKANCTFYPPVKLISFNRNLNHNDGLLISKVSASANIRYGDAKKLVEEFVADLKKKLSKGEKVTFEHIGTFINNSEGNAQFEPDRGVNYDLNSFGLTPFQFPVLEGYDVRKKLMKEPFDDTIRSSNLKKYLWRAAVIIPLVGALIAVPLSTDILKTKVQVTSMNPLISSTSDSGKNEKPEVSEERLPQDSKVTDNVTDTIPSEQNIAIVSISAPAQEISKADYCIIAGSFKSESNASMFVKRLSEEGYAPEIIQAPNGFYRVSAFRCKTLSEAQSAREMLGFRYPGTWVIRLR